VTIVLNCRLTLLLLASVYHLSLLLQLHTYLVPSTNSTFFQLFSVYSRSSCQYIHTREAYLPLSGIMVFHFYSGTRQNLHLSWPAKQFRLQLTKAAVYSCISNVHNLAFVQVELSSHCPDHWGTYHSCTTHITIISFAQYPLYSLIVLMCR